MEGQKFLFSQSDNGWQTTVTFFAYVKAVHEEQVNRGVEPPYAIYLDGYPAHMNLEIYTWARDHNILFVIFFPNATFILQPCDVAIIKPIKDRYVKETKIMKNELVNGGNDMPLLDEVDFVKILARAIRNGITPQIIKNGFRACGLYPLDRSAVHDERLLGSSNSKAISTTASSSSHIASTSSSIHTTELLNVSPDFEQQNALVDDPSLPLNSCLPRTKSKILQEMTMLNNELTNVVSDDDHACKFFISLLDQQLGIVCNPTKPNSVQISTPTREETLNAIFTHPPPNKRATKRIRINACGVMSSDDVIEKLEQKEKEKEAAEQLAQEKKRIRLEKKQIKEVELKIKKERVEKNIKRVYKKRVTTIKPSQEE